MVRQRKESFVVERMDNPPEAGRSGGRLSSTSSEEFYEETSDEEIRTRPEPIKTNYFYGN